MGGPSVSGAVGRFNLDFHGRRAAGRLRAAAEARPLFSVPLLALALSLVCAGCTDPSAVGRFASIGKSADGAFSAIANDLAESCVRRERYRLLGEWQSDVATLDEEANRSCAAYERNGRRLRGAHRILIRYLTALGELAGEGAVSYDDSIGELSGSLENADMLGDNGIDAARDVCALLMDAAEGKWRRHRLGSVIEKANEDVAVLAAALGGIISEDYTRLLDGESEAARKFYLGKLRDHGDGEPLASVLVWTKWREEEAEIEGKRRAAAAYVKVLDRLADGHQDLYDHRDAPDSRESRKLLLRHAAAIENLLTEVHLFF